MAEPPTAARDAFLFLACLLAVTALYLWPFHLTLSPVFQVNDAAVTADPPGVAFARNGMLRTRAPLPDFYQAFAGGTGLTVEARVTTASLDQSGPARILTASADPGNRNFTLAQDGAELVFRLRASADDPNGVATEARVPGVFVAGREQHLLVSYDLATIAVYVDGALRGTLPAPGDLSAWDPGYPLAVGNELTGDRPWQGTISAAAVYNRALTPPLPAGDDGAAVWSYDFRTGWGEATHGAALTRPRIYLHGTYPDLLAPYARRPADAVLSFTVFAVLGALLVPLIARGRPAYALPVAAILVAALATSLESFQIYVDGRTSSIRDLAAALAGGLTGVALRSWQADRRRR
jgi:hypothetical protein